MELDAQQTAQSVRFIEARLLAVSARLRASRTRPLDKAAVEELTALRFAETRLSRRLRLLVGARSAQHDDVHLLDPVGELVTELNDAQAEATRRGALILLRVRALERVSRKLTFIDALASLVEDGVDAGANYLSLETRLRGDHVRLCLTMDAGLQCASFGVDMLSLPYQVEVEQTPSGLLRIMVYAQTAREPARHNHGANRWTAPRPHRV